MTITDEDVAAVTEDDIGVALMGMIRAFDAEYDQMTEEDLASRWLWKYDEERSVTWNMYLFYDRLSLFAGSCRRWEERHNGSSCVVERVRDKYVIPRIKEFEAILREKMT